MEKVLAIAGAYLLGSIPFGLLIGLTKGVDVRTQGSGNIGATNVGRVLGRKWGHLCLGLDLLKGLVPVALAGWFLRGTNPPPIPDQIAWLAIGLAAVIGHVFPVYLGFRGGKGVATTIGVGLGIYPFLTFPMIVSLLVYAAARFGTGMVSLGSILLGIAFPLAFLAYCWWDHVALSAVWPCFSITLILGLLILIRHRSNLGRILRGQEPRVAQKL